LTCDRRCKVCGSGALYFVHQEVDGPWYRCLDCGCDSSTRTYAEVRADYNIASLEHNLEVSGSREALAETMMENIRWFDAFATPVRRFLDIGCNEGAGMEAMARRGWEVYGFDVFPEAKTRENVVIEPDFRADQFPRAFGAVMAREVIEHVENWKELLHQVWLALMPGGLFQIQTPKPICECNAIVYQRLHLQIFTPMALQYYLEQAQLEIIDRHIWALGHAYLCRKSP
jgi:2-polyprenyl-3-methyl-5-hydroxy-6-metoxy-1,4-benzoquinol methylase